MRHLSGQPRTALLLPLTMACAMTLAGCGAKVLSPKHPAQIGPAQRVSGPEVRAIDATVRGFSRAVASNKGNPGAYLAAGYRGGRSPAALRKTLGIGKGGGAVTFTIQEAASRSAVADVTYSLPKPQRDRLQIVKIKGAWKIAAIIRLTR